MLSLEKKHDVYSLSIYQRILNELPEGSFYNSGIESVPYVNGVASFLLKTSNIGSRHLLRSSKGGVVKPFIADKDLIVLELNLETGVQTLTIEVFDSEGTLIDILSKQVQISNLATYLYSASQIIAPFWIDLIDLNAKIMSGTRLLNLENTLPESIKSALPEDFSSKSLALKLLLKAKSTGLTEEAFENLVAIFCDLNHPMLVKGSNGTEIDNSILYGNQSCEDVIQVHCWTHNKGESVRLVRDIMCNNFPERYPTLEDTSGGIIVGQSDNV